jgi:choline-sulfatase
MDMAVRWALLFLLLGTQYRALADSPNILLVTIDTARADRMGFLGSTRGLTPNLDSAARQSVVFEKAYTQAPLTTVSHATILTGTYPQFHRVSDFGTRLPSRIPNLADLLRQNGYRTAAFVGSIILDPRNGLAPGFDRGFDVYDAGYTLRRTGEDRYKTVERRADEVVTRAMRWLSENSGHRFFLWIHLYDPHQPYDPPGEYAKRFAAQPYDGEIASTDAALGRLLVYLQKRGIFGTSLIAVMADHGESLGQHGEEGHGIFLYDETVHIPLFLKLPGARFAGRRVKSRVRLVDVAPTVLEVAGVPVPEEMQGESLLRALAANAAERPVYSETDYPQQGFGWSKIWSLREGKYLFIQAPRRELYDTASDSVAADNIADRREAVADVLAAQLAEIQRRYGSTLLPSNEAIDVTQSQRETLAALGYLARSAKSETAKVTGADPKDKVQVANQLQDAMLLIDTGHPDQAIPLLEKVVASAPDIYVAQLELGRAESQRRNYAGALAPLTKATELMPDSGAAQYELGLALFESGDGHGAAANLEKAAALMPESADAHFSLAAVDARIDRVPEALRELQTTLGLNSSHYRANLLMGRILFLQGHSRDALPYLEGAVRVQPTSREAHLFLAEAYAQVGMDRESKSEQEEAEHLPLAKP